MTVPSPCVSICTMDEASGFCKGCKRTIDEVAMWLYLSDVEKSRILGELGGRKLSSES